MLLAYATFTSVVMGSILGGSCGGPTTSYATVGISSFFLESRTRTPITTATVATRNATARKAPSAPTTPPTIPPMLVDGVVVIEGRGVEEVGGVVEEVDGL